MESLTSPRFCRRCGSSSIKVEFAARENLCINCRRELGRQHYAENQAYYLAKARRRQAHVRSLAREWILDYLTTHPCVDCATADIRVLEFDHRDGTDKRDSVSVLTGQGYSLRSVKEEVAKCDVRCANCHLIRTRIQQGWWKNEIPHTSARSVRDNECARQDSNL